MSIIIETERLIIRELVPADAAGIFELDSDREVQRFVGNAPLTTMDQAHSIIAMIRKQYEVNGIGRWAMTDRGTGRFLGWTGLKLFKTTANHHIDFYELGYRLMKKYWGKGLATESAIACVKYGFEVMSLTDIYAMAHVYNAGSQKVLEKTGFRFVNDFEHDGELNKWYAITKSEAERTVAKHIC